MERIIPKFVVPKYFISYFNTGIGPELKQLYSFIYHTVSSHLYNIIYGSSINEKKLWQQKD